ncbi:MAG: toxic anion resistance protein [Christensenellales bacterium]|jgi:uncharacterized protein YaaN involved in tellurite resistance
MNQDNTHVPTIPVIDLEPAKKSVSPVTADVPPPLDESALTDEEKKIVEDVARQIDISDSSMVLQYGSDAQRRMSNFSETALSSVRTKDMGEVGDMISSLVLELRSFSADEPKGGGLFRRVRRGIETLKARYSKVENNVDKIAAILEGHQVQLFKDIAVFDRMYDNNLANFKALSLYIIAGKKKLAEAREVTLQELRQKAQESGLAEDAQAVNDYAALCERFEKKLYDLELTRMISIQMGPQIRLVQNNDMLMADKIQSTLVNTIPLWKSQMVLALGIHHSNEAIAAQRKVSDMTNELLLKNAETLKQGTIAAAKESERGIVEIETLTQTNNLLIQTLDEMVNIQKEGRQKRLAAEVELVKIEGQIKQKLLELSK